MELIDGNKIAAALIAELKAEVATLPGRPPCIALVRVGEDPASVSYVTKKQKTCAEQNHAHRKNADFEMQFIHC